MLQSTFQLVPGLGPVRERRLWCSGARRLVRAGRLEEPLGGRTDSRSGPPSRTQRTLFASATWRASPRLCRPASTGGCFDAFRDDAAYLDIETGDDVWGRESISAIGFLDRNGPRLLLAGRDLHLFPSLPGSGVCW